MINLISDYSWIQIYSTIMLCALKFLSPLYVYQYSNLRSGKINYVFFYTLLNTFRGHHLSLLFYFFRCSLGFIRFSKQSTGKYETFFSHVASQADSFHIISCRSPSVYFVCLVYFFIPIFPSLLLYLQIIDSSIMYLFLS